MKSTFAGFALVALTALAGCSQGTPGGPGTTDKAPTYGQANDTFNLSVPLKTSTVQQGKQTETMIGVKRGKNFDEDISLRFTDIPPGVTIEPGSMMIKHGDSDAKFTFKAGDNAPIGDFLIKITGHPTKGSDAEVEYKLKIAAKDSFSLSVPRMSTTLKQGETQTVSIGITREKDFDQDVALKFGDMPTGVTLKPAAPVIKHGEGVAQLTLTGANDASLGNFAIRVTGHPSIGVENSNEFILLVVKE